MTDQPPATGSTSDGYHTFDELYTHRRALTAALAVSLPGHAWRSKAHHPDNEPIFHDYFIVGIDLPTGTITYHYHLDHWDDFTGVPTVDHAPPWDGASPDDTITRLLSYVGGAE